MSTRNGGNQYVIHFRITILLEFRDRYADKKQLETQ